MRTWKLTFDERSNLKLYTFAVIYIIPILLAAHIIAPDTYEWTQHTISQLAAQGYEYSWVMNLGFIGFGGLVLAEALRRLVHDPMRRWTEGPLIVCGTMFLLSSIFSTRPFIEGVLYSNLEAQIHGGMATLARVMVSLSMLSYAILDSPRNRRVVHVIFFVLVISLNVLLEILGNAQGIVQRMLVIVVLTWLVIIDGRKSSSPRRGAIKSSA